MKSSGANFPRISGSLSDDTCFVLLIRVTDISLTQEETFVSHTHTHIYTYLRMGSFKETYTTSSYED